MIFNIKNINPWQMIKLKYYHMFAKYALQNKHLLPNEVINNIKNKEQLAQFRNMILQEQRKRASTVQNTKVGGVK